MRLTGFQFLLSMLAVVSFLQTGASAASGSPQVPVGDPVYRFFEKCEARGLVSPLLTSAQPISRAEAGRWLVVISSRYPELDDRLLRADLDYFIREFADDINADAGETETPQRLLRPIAYNVQDALTKPRWHLSRVNREDFSFILDPVAWGRMDLGSDEAIYRRATGLQFRGIFQEWLGYYFRFVDHTERGNQPYSDRTRLLDDRFGYVGPLQGGNATYYDMAEASLNVGWKGVDATFGKDHAAWGPGQFDKLLLSGEGPSMDQLRLGFDLGSNARFTYIAAKLTPWSVPEDTLYRTPEGWTRVQPTQKWLSAHRLEYALWENVLIGISEAVVWGERGFDPAYLNPLSFIYSAQHNGQDRDNLLMEGDVTVSVRKRALIYMALLIDDLSTSQIGKGFVGNKIGVMAGAQFMDLELDGLIAGIEYIRLEPFVYTHFYPVNRFTNWTSSLGAGLKPNSDRLTLDLNYRLIRSLTCDAQFSFNRHGDLGGELSQTVIANTNRASRFLDDRRSGWTAWELQLRWEPVPGGVLECGYIQNDENSFLPDRFYLGTGYRY